MGYKLYHILYNINLIVCHFILNLSLKFNIKQHAECISLRYNSFNYSTCEDCPKPCTDFNYQRSVEVFNSYKIFVSYKRTTLSMVNIISLFTSHLKSLSRKPEIKISM